MFHSFFETLDKPEMNIEYSHLQSNLPDLQTAETLSNQIITSQNTESNVTQTAQVVPMIQRVEVLPTG